MSTAIKNCNCKNEFQDLRYGNGKRVHNSTAKTEPQIWRCTVCKNETSGGAAAGKKKK